MRRAALRIGRGFQPALAKAGVEHPIGIIKRVFGFAKVRYRGLKKRSSPHCHLCAGQPVHGAPASLALRCRVTCLAQPPPVAHRRRHTNNRTATPALSLAAAMAMADIYPPAPLFRPSLECSFSRMAWQLKLLNQEVLWSGRER
jgi:hypothetical protein